MNNSSKHPPRRQLANFMQWALPPLAAFGCICAILVTFAIPILNYQNLTQPHQIGLATLLFSWLILLIVINFSYFKKSGDVERRVRDLFYASPWGLTILIFAIATLFSAKVLIPDNRLTPSILWPVFIPSFLVAYYLWPGKNNSGPIVKFSIAVSMLFYLCSSFVAGTFFSHSLIPALWLFVAMLLGHFVLRSMELEKASLHGLHKIMNDLLILDDHYSESAMQSLANLIVDFLGYERAFLLSVEPRDGEGKFLHVIGAAGRGVNSEEIRNLKFPIEMGICGESITRNEPIIVNNVRTHPTYYPGGFHDTRAELAFPISDGSSIVAVIDLQSSFPSIGPWRTFTNDDIEVIDHLVDALKASARLDILRDYRGIKNSIDVLTETDDTDLEDRFLELAKTLFDADKPVYYSLAPGTGYPIGPPIAIGLNHPEKMGDSIIKREGNLLNLIARWRPLYAEDVFNNNRLDVKTDDLGPTFIEREGVKSMCFLPIGSKMQKIGVLFLNYTHPTNFPISRRLALRAFSQAAAPSFWRSRHLQPLYEKFGAPSRLMHGIKHNAGFERGPIELGLENIWKKVKNSEEAETDFLVYRDRLRSFWNGVSLADAVASPNFLADDLKTVLSGFIATGLSTKPGVIDITKIDPRIESESKDLRRILYFICVEAIGNAIVHGQSTTKVVVEINRERSWLTLSVKDNGVGFNILPHEEDQVRSQTGIFEMVENVSRLMSAQTFWNDTAEGNGTHITIYFPVLPFELVHQVEV